MKQWNNITLLNVSKHRTNNGKRNEFTLRFISIRCQNLEAISQSPIGKIIMSITISNNGFKNIK